MEVSNKQTQTRPNMHTKGVSCRPHPCAKETQTEGKDLLPIHYLLIVHKIIDSMESFFSSSFIV